MTPNPDSVAVLREKHIADLQFLRNDCGPDEPYAAALDAAIAALSAQGEPFCYAMEYPHVMPTIDYINAPEFVKRFARAEQLRDGCEREFGEPAKITPLYLHPAPPGADAVTEEMVARARDALIDHDAGPDYVSSNAMHAALTAALAARTGKGEG